MENIEQYIGCLKDQAFSPSKSRGTRGDFPHFESACIDPYLRDMGVILNCKAHRRLSGKTQVFTGLNNPHVRRRSQHTNEVVATAVDIANILGLNASLCQAEGMGHDMGHAPYGHLGERIISEISGRKFKHNIFGVVVAQEIERKGIGLNLTYETLLGMRWHSNVSEAPPGLELPLECRVVMYADKIAYTFADINDVQRFGLPQGELMLEKAGEFGFDHRERSWTCIRALVAESAREGTVSFSKSETAQKFWELQGWMYKNVYGLFDQMRPAKPANLISAHGFLGRSPLFEGCDPAILLALMTDKEVDDLATILENKFNPKLQELPELGIIEIAPSLKGRQIDFTQADLDPSKFFPRWKLPVGI